MIPNTRDNNEIVRKLERILGTCSNIRDEIEIIIKKNNSEEDKTIISEDINRIAGNLNSVMKSTEPFFRYYLIVPTTTERDDIPMMVNTSRNDGLIKYEEKIVEHSKNIKEKSYDISFENIQIDDIKYNDLNNIENYNRIRNNMNKLSRLLSDKLKEASKFGHKYIEKKEVDNRIKFVSLNDPIQYAKLLLNRK